MPHDHKGGGALSWWMLSASFRRRKRPPGKACATTSSPSDIGATSPVHFLFASRQAAARSGHPRTMQAQAFRRPADPCRRDDLMRRINDEFVYDAKATTVSTPPPMSFAAAARRVPGLRPCHDLRPARHRVAAAYVSGYLADRAESGVPGCKGRRMHAWSGSGAARRPAGTGSIRPTPCWPATTTWCGDRPRLFRVAPVGGVVFASGRQKSTKR